MEPLLCRIIGTGPQSLEQISCYCTGGKEVQGWRPIGEGVESSWMRKKVTLNRTISCKSITNCGFI